MSTLLEAVLVRDKFLTRVVVAPFRGIADSVAWANVINKPTEFTPAAHNHASDAWLLGIITPLNNHVADTDLHVDATILAKIDGIADNANNYVHPASHSPSIITQDASNRFVTDLQIAGWDAKAETSYVDSAVAALSNALVGAAPETLDTIQEIAAALQNNADVITAIDDAITARALQTDFLSHTGDASLHVTQTILDQISDNVSKLAGIEAEATADQTGAEIVALLNAEGYQEGGPSLSANLPITKATGDTFTSLLTQMNAAGNEQGNDIIVTLADGLHNFNATLVELLAAYNGQVIIQGSTVAQGSGQTASIVLNAAGYMAIKSAVNIQLRYVKIVITSATQQIPFSGTKLGVMNTYRCCYDLSGIQAAAIVFSGFLKVISKEDHFIPHATLASTLAEDCNLEIYDATGSFTNAIGGSAGLEENGGSVLLSNSDGVFTNKVASGSSAKVIGEAVAASAEVPTITPGTTSATDSTISVPLTPNRTGTLYGRLYLASATPTASEVAAGTGAIETQSAVVAADTEETLVFSDASITASTAYRVFYWLEGFAPTVEVKNLTQSTTAPADTTAPVATFTPADSATDIAVDAVIYIDYNEAVLHTDGSEITDANVDALITLKEDNAAGADISFDAVINVGKTQIAITPSADLPNSQAVYVAVGAVEDAAGNENTGSNATFTTVAAASYGANIVVNGLFSISLYAWSGTNWAWSDVNAGEALHTAGSTDPLVGNTSETQAEVTQGQEYVVKYRVGGRTAGTIQATLGGNGAGLTRSADGYYSERITAGSTDTLIRFVPSSDFDGWIDEVIIQTVDGVPNMLVNGTFDNSTGLSLGAGYTVSDGVLNYDGLNTYANTTFTHNDKIYNGHNYHLKINVVTGPLILLLEVGGFEYEIDSNTYAVGLHEFDFTPTGLSQPSTFRIRANTGCGAGSVDNVEITETFA